MAIYWFDGFEHGILSSDGSVNAPYGEVTGTPTSDTSPVYSGSRSAGFATTQDFFRWDALDTAIPSSSQTVIVVQFKIYFTTLPSTNELSVLKIWTGTPFYENWIYLTSGGAMASKYWGSPPTDDSGTNSYSLSTGTWYTVDARVDVSGATWTFDWQITPDGGSPTTMTQRTVSNTGGEIGALIIGWIDANANTADFNIDDLVCANATGDYPLGDYKVLGFSPNGVGTHSIDVGSGSSSYFLTDAGALSLPDTTSYQRLDDVPLSGGTDYVGIKPSTGSGGTDTNLLPKAVDALAQSNYNESAATLRANIDEDADSPDGNWGTATSDNSDTDVRVAIANSTGPPSTTGTVTLGAYVRKETGTGTPTARLELWYNGSSVAVGSEQNITSTTGQKITQNFDLATINASNELGDGTQLQVRLYGTKTGGAPAARSTVEAGAINIDSLPYDGSSTPPTNTWYLEYGLADSSETDAITAVRVIGDMVNSTTGASASQLKLRADGAEDAVFNGDIGSTTRVYRAKHYAQTPNSTSWSDTLFDGATLRWGFSNDATPNPRLHSVIAEVLFEVAGATNWTSSVTFPLSIGYTTTGKLTALSSATFPLSIAYTDVGKVTALSSSTFPLAAGFTTDATRTALGTSTFPLTVAFDTTGSAAKSGSASFPLTVGFDTQGFLTAKSSSTVPYTIGFDTTGKLTALSSATLPLTVGFDTTGKLTALSSATVPLVITFDTQATPTKYGDASFPLTLNYDTTGRLTAYATVGVPLTATFTTQGLLEALAATATALNITFTSQAVIDALSSATFPLTIGYDTTPLGDATGSSTFEITAGFDTTGTLDALAALGFPLDATFTTQALLTALSSATYPLDMTLSTDALVEALAATSLPLDIAYDVQALVTAVASASFPLTVTFTTDGTVQTGAVYGDATLGLTIGYDANGRLTAYSSTDTGLTIAYDTTGTGGVEAGAATTGRHFGRTWVDEWEEEPVILLVVANI